jgi:hypothetical protein
VVGSFALGAPAMLPAHRSSAARMWAGCRHRNAGGGHLARWSHRSMSMRPETDCARCRDLSGNRFAVVKGQLRAATRQPMRRSSVTRRSDISVAPRAKLTRTSIVIWLGLLLIEALERRPEALRVGCAIRGGGAAGAPARYSQDSAASIRSSNSTGCRPTHRSQNVSVNASTT